MWSGVPWGLAHEMEAERRRAYCVYFGQLEGGEYDFDAMCWKEKT